MAIILAVIAGGLIPALFGFFTKVYEIRSIQPAAVNNLKSAAQIYTLLFNIKKNIGADRILVFRAHDSGGPIPNKSSIVAEVFADSLDGIFGEWQSQPLDIDYIRLLEELIDKKRIIKDVSMLEESILKDSYVFRGTHFADLRYLGANKDSLYYVSFEFSKEKPFDSIYSDLVRSGCEKLKTILKSSSAITK